VSKSHARLELRDDTWFLIDLGSKNKTFLRGNELGHTPRALRSGDCIHIGDFKIVFGKSLWPSEGDTRPQSSTDGFHQPVLRLANVLQHIAEAYGTADEDVRDERLAKTIDTVFDPRVANHPAVRQVVRVLKDARDGTPSGNESSGSEPSTGQNANGPSNPRSGGFGRRFV
jgi:predicted component of type VI protein secretion system